MHHKEKLTNGLDRQSSTEVKNQDMDHTGEVVTSDQSVSKLSRNSKGSKHRKSAKDERPSSAKSVSSIESKFKSSLVKFNKELKDIQTQSEKLNSLRDSMAKMREEMIDKGLRDPPILPEMPETMNSSSRPQSRSSSPKGKIARQMCSLKNKSLLEETYKKISDNGVLDIILTELPTIEQSYKNLENTINTAHDKQTNLENNMNRYKNDLTNILMNIANQSNEDKTSDLFLQELQTIKETFEQEKNSLMKELSTKDEELRILKANMENEQSKKLNLESTLSATYEQNQELKEKCGRYSQQLELLRKYQAMSKTSGKQDLSIQNSHLLSEVDSLKVQLKQAHDQQETSTKEIEKLKQEMNKLRDEKEEIKNELLKQCQQVYFEKQDQINSIKQKMESIVNLKNSMMITDITPDEVFNLQVLMKINDPDFLKKKIVSFHKRLQDEEEAKTQLEYNLSAQDNKVDNLIEELSEKSKTVKNMESLLKKLKNKVNRSHEIIMSLQSREFNEIQELKSKEDVEIEEDLSEWLACDEIAELQQKLKLSEEKFYMAEERRVRNEERIANLEIKLSKYSYH